MTAPKHNHPHVRTPTTVEFTNNPNTHGRRVSVPWFPWLRSRIVFVPVNPNLATVRYPKAWSTNRCPWMRISLSNMSSMSALTVLDNVISSSGVKDIHVQESLKRNLKRRKISICIGYQWLISGDKKSKCLEEPNNTESLSSRCLASVSEA